MYMQINSKALRELRKARAWSQSELAELSGLSLRTVQRIEKSGTASLESVKALSAVYDLNPASLQLTPALHTEGSDANNIVSGDTSFRLSDQAIQLSLILFLPAAVVMLFMLLTHLPTTNWVHTVRLTLFSNTLPEVVSFLINMTIGLLPLVALSLLAGVSRDVYKQQGPSVYIQQLLTKRPMSMQVMVSKLQIKFRRVSYLLKKPLLCCGLLFALFVGVLSLSMEPYQKANVKRLISHVSQNNE